MPFKRVWDSSCPRIWDQWQADGREWVIQDLRPEDDALAVQMLVEYFCPDEVMCTCSGILDDPVGLRSICDMWADSLAQRTSLGCYTEVNGQMMLVGFNVCTVQCVDEKDDYEMKGESWINIVNCLKFMDKDVDKFKALDTDKLLYGLGLVVIRDFRGAKLGGRILQAREPLCRHLGVKGTATLFTGTASQKSAARCGYKTIKESTLEEMADASLNFPREQRVMKLMIKKYF